MGDTLKTSPSGNTNNDNENYSRNRISDDNTLFEDRIQREQQIFENLKKSQLEYHGYIKKLDEQTSKFRRQDANEFNNFKEDLEEKYSKSLKKGDIDQREFHLKVARELAIKIREINLNRLTDERKDSLRLRTKEYQEQEKERKKQYKQEKKENDKNFKDRLKS